MADKKEKEREGDDGEVHAQSERDGELPFPNFRPYPPQHHRSRSLSCNWQWP